MYYQIYFNCVQTIHGLAIAKKVMEKSIMFDGVSINAVISACLHCSPLEHVIYPMSKTHQSSEELWRTKCDKIYW